MVEIAVLDMDGPSVTDASDLVRAGKLDLAKWAYTSIVEKDPGNAAAWYGLGVVLNELNDRELSINSFLKSYEYDNKHAPTVANLAILYSLDDVENADKFARIAIELGLEDEILTRLCTEEEPPLMEARAVIETPSSEETELEIIKKSSEKIELNEFEKALEIISPAVEGEFHSSSELWTLCSICLLELVLISDAENSIKFACDLPSGKWIEDGGFISAIGTTDCNSKFELMEKIRLKIDVKSEDNQEENNVLEPEDDVQDEDISLEDSKVVLIKNAKKHSEDGDHVSAVKVWKEILERFGSTSDAWRGMASALEAAGHIEKSKQCLSKAAEIDFELGEIDQNEDVDLVSAAELAKKQIMANQYQVKDDVNVSIEWYNKGLNLLAEVKSSEALHCFEQSIKTIPREEIDLRVRVHNGKGHALHQMGEYSQSIQAYHQAISMSPESVSSRTLYNMGSSYAAMEHFTDAIKCFEQALEREIDDDDAELCRTQMNRCRLLLKEQLKVKRN